jgi:DHA1 family tetracycline resistance protein-like MFS transporter
MSVASLIGPSLFAGTFALAIDPRFAQGLPGAPYLLAAALLAVATLIAARVATGHAPR